MPKPAWVPLRDLHEVECFLAVAETLHFRSAAGYLHLPQPHLSRIIRRLEGRLGVELFTRTSRHVELTPAGRVFAEDARALWASAERASRRVGLAAEGGSGSLSVGFVPWAAFHRLAEHVTTFLARFPDVNVELSETIPSALIAGLLNHELDIAYVRPVPHPALRLYPLATEPYCAVVPVSHPWATLPAIPLSLLQDEPFVCISRRGESPQTYDVLAEPLALAGVQPTISIEVPSVTSAIAFVRAGAGFTLITASHKALAPDLRFVPLVGVDRAYAW